MTTDYKFVVVISQKYEQACSWVQQQLLNKRIEPYYLAPAASNIEPYYLAPAASNVEPYYLAPAASNVEPYYLAPAASNKSSF